MADRPPNSLRELNRRRVLAALRDRHATNRGELCRVTGLARTTVTSLVAELLGDGIVVEALAEPGTGRAGRPAAALTLAPRPQLVVGIDFGHSHCTVGIADSAARVVAECSTPMDVDASADRALAHAAATVHRLVEGLGARRTLVAGAALGLPAPVDLRTGAVGSGNILPGWVDRRPAAELAELLGLPVAVDNDANLGALAEATYGAARGMSDVVYVKVSTGIGAGLVLGGEVFRGSTGLAGEIGHVPVDPDGAVCRCGNRGCLETVVSVTHVLRLLQPAHREPLDVARVVELVEAGDVGAARVLRDAGATIGRVLADLCNGLNPEALVLGGELSQVGEALLGGVRESIGRSAQPGIVRALRVLAGTLGPRAQLLGAVALAQRHASPVGW
ncbi:MAG TPA: ROK family protein [Mycobacteriales bacterium]|nr:ROK family protein [Mycobacteriales bacterium]